MKLKPILLSIAFLLLLSTLSKPSLAATQQGQFQLGTGIGLFVGSDRFDPAFDIDVEPEYFFTDHISLSGRFDATVGGTDSVGFGARFRYYFNFPNHSRFSLFVGAGAGFLVALDHNSSAFGDIALPVFGFQYDLTKHVKLGSDISFNILFNGDKAAFATRLIPIQFKWAF